MLATMENAENDEALPVVAILKYVRCVEHLQYKLAIFIPAGDRAAKARKLGEKLRLLDNCLSDDAGKLRMVLMQKRGKAFEIGERVLRPFDLYRSRHGLYAGVPQVSSQRTTWV